MTHGGKRKGAGRKPLPGRKTSSYVDDATAQIDKAQPRAVRALLDGLLATKAESLMIGKDDKGKPIFKVVNNPDHHVRVKAAGMLLNKRIPDLARNEVTGKDGEELNLGIVVYPGEKKQPGAV